METTLRLLASSDTASSRNAVLRDVSFVCRHSSGKQQTPVRRGPAAERCRHCQRGPRWQLLQCSAAVSSQPAPSAVKPPTEAVELTEPLRRDTAILEAGNPNAPGGRTRVYVLGISHISHDSCEEVRELIHLVRPDVVLLELCKDRLRLLLDQANPGKQLWHTPRVRFAGLPEAGPWPSREQLTSVLRTQPGRTVTTQDIEGDCTRLLATGLFARVRPGTQLPITTQAPAFIADRDGHLNPVIPLNQVEFTVAERKLPPITSFALRMDSGLGAGAAISQANADAAAAEAVAASQEERCSTVEVALRLLPQLQALAAAHVPGQEVEVVYRGLETGQVEAVFKAATPEYLARSYSTGLEDSATGGEGLGVEPFRPNRGPLKLSPNMIIENLAKVLDISADTINSISDFEAAPGAQEAQPPAPGTGVRMWTVDEAAAAAEADDEDGDESGWAGRFGALVTGTYAQLQIKAAEKCGVAPGEAWRTALEAAAMAGARQVHLGDLPASIAARRLGDGIWRSTLPRAVLLAASAVGGIAGTLTHALPEGAGLAVGGAVAALAALTMGPLASPLAQIWLLGQKPKEAIEDTVRLKDPIQGADLARPVEIWGEDALLQWPGARQPLIAERDAYMARTIWAAATGTPASPAYVADTDGGRRMLRFGMPAGGPEPAAPSGYGEGEYAPVQDAAAVVAVVGSAHVRGVIREWGAIGREDCLERLEGLLADEIHAS